MPDLPATGKIVFRVSAGARQGMGHLARCKHLARELATSGLDVRFIVDQFSDAVGRHLHDIDVKALYENEEFRDEESDAAACLNVVEKGDWLVVDDYRLTKQWQVRLREKAAKIIVIDDLANREHDCDYLIDYRWRNQIADSSVYAALVPQHCTQLLGPSYCLLAKSYQQKYQRKTTWQEGNKKPFIVMLSLGGGGDLFLLGMLLKGLLPKFEDMNIEFWPVVGAMAVNVEHIHSLARVHTIVKPIVDATDLSTFFEQADLFIGAAGTSIYELNCKQLPSLTFAIAENQKNELNNLEDLGLYMHLPFSELKGSETINADAFAKLIKCIRQQYQRVFNLSASAKVTIDGYGVTRVVAALLGEKPSCESEAVLAANPSWKDSDVYRKELKPNLVIQEIDDREINHYLDARNLPENRMRMTLNEEVSRCDHYFWWFNNRRSSYLLRDGNERLLYIWHQLERYEDQEYLIGGWFVASGKCGFEASALALKWQLAFCQTLFPQATWLAVINKENRFVNLLNSLHGFEEVKAGDKSYQAISAFFPYANRDKFNYLKCESQVGTVNV